MTMDNNVRTVLISYLILSLVERDLWVCSALIPATEICLSADEPRAPFSARAVLPAALPNLR